jgi:hypothetical protein
VSPAAVQELTSFTREETEAHSGHIEEGEGPQLRRPGNLNE